VKGGKKRSVRYDVEGSLKSSGVSGKLDSYTTIKDSGFVSTKTVLGYSIPKVAKNKITLGGKFNDRSTKSYRKYTLKRSVRGFLRGIESCHFYSTMSALINNTFKKMLGFKKSKYSDSSLLFFHEH